MLCLSLSLGCAAAPEKELALLWPAPPQEPKFMYVRSYYGQADLVEIGFWDKFFGLPAMQGLDHPNGVFSHGDKMYVTLAGRGDIVVMDMEKKSFKYFGDSSAVKLGRVAGITGLADGSSIFVSDAGNKRVVAFDLNGTVKTIIGKKGELENPAGVAVNSTLGRLYVADSHGCKVNVYALTGELLFTFGKPGFGNGEFLYPSGVALQETSGKVYIVDTQNFRVQVFDQDGKFLDKFGELGDSFGNFSRPKGIAIDQYGHIYVVDAAFGNVQVFDDKFRLLIFIGAVGDKPGQFNLPIGIFIDTKDRIFVTDSLNGRVSVFQYLSEQWPREHPEEYKEMMLPQAQEQQGKK